MTVKRLFWRKIKKKCSSVWCVTVLIASITENLLFDHSYQSDMKFTKRWLMIHIKENCDIKNFEFSGYKYFFRSVTWESTAIQLPQTNQYHWNYKISTIKQNARGKLDNIMQNQTNFGWVLAAYVWPEVSDCILYDLSADAQICFAQTKASRGIAAATENKPSKTVLLASCATLWLTMQLQQTWPLPILFMRLGGCTATTETSND